MSYRRKCRPQANFVVVSNALAQHPTLSFQARGLIVYLLSKPDGWQGQASDIEKAGNIKYEARRTITIEAEKAGYLRFVVNRLPNGQIDQYYEAQDEPLPPEEHTKSWEYRKGPTPDEQGSVKPSHSQPTPGEPGTGGGGSLDKKEVQKKEVQKKEGERPRLLTPEELAERTGNQPTQEETEAAQLVLFLQTGKSYCINRWPTTLAFVQNIRRTRGGPGLARLVTALQKPEQHGISRTWATWQIEEALWPSRGGRGVPVAAIPNPTKENALLQAAVNRLKRARELGQTDQDFLAYGTDLSREIKLQAIESLTCN